MLVRYSFLAGKTKYAHFRTFFFFFPKEEPKCRSSDLFSAPFKHQVLLTLVQPSFLQCPEVQNPVFPLQQLIENGCTKNTLTMTNLNTLSLTWKKRGVFCRSTSRGPCGTTAELTFDLLLRSSSMACSSRCAHIVSVDVFEEDLSIPPSQRARLKHTSKYPQDSFWTRTSAGGTQGYTLETRNLHPLNKKIQTHLILTVES